MGKKNKKVKERCALLRLAIDGERQPKVNPEWAFERGGIEGDEQTGEEVDASGALIVRVDDDLDVPDVETRKLPKPRGARTKTTDKDRFYEWYLAKELERPGARIDTMPRNKIVHVRSHAELDSLVERLLDLARRTKKELVIGLDTEGSVTQKQAVLPEQKADTIPALLQLSACADGNEVTAVVQLYSKRTMDGPKDIFSEGTPHRLAEIFRIKKAIFAGKSVSDDVKKVAKMSGLSAEELKEVLVIDTARLFYFADALARGAEATEVWVEGGSSEFLGETSLKDFCQFVNPSLILDKSPYHRNHHANFDEAKGPIRVCDIKYAAVDARRTRESVDGFADLASIPARLFATSVSTPHLLDSLSFERILRKYAKLARKSFPAIKEALDDFSAEECELVSKLRDAAPKFESRMAAAQKEILEHRALKKLLLRKLKNERGENPIPNACVIVRDPPSLLRILPPSPLSLNRPPTADIAPECGRGGGRAETHPDPDALPEKPREKGWSAAEVVDVIDSSDTGGDSDDATAFKRGPRKSVSCRTLEQVTGITRIVEGRSDTGYFLQREDAVIISSVSLPNISSFTDKNSPAAPPPTPASSSVSLAFPTSHTFPNVPLVKRVQSPSRQVLVSYPISPPNPASPPRPVPPPPPSPPPPPPRSSLPPPLAGAASYPRCLAPPVAIGSSGTISSEEWKRRYDEKSVRIAFNRLNNSEEQEFETILGKLTAPNEKTTAERFLSTLKQFEINKVKKKTKMYAVARAMMNFLPIEGRAFVLKILEDAALGRNRLNVAVNLRFFCMSPIIILDDLFGDHHVEGVLAAAVDNFPVDEVTDVVRFLAVHSRQPKKILARMRQSDCFKVGYYPRVSESTWKEANVKKFIEFVCGRIGIAIPEEAKRPFLRVRLDRELELYAKGETEVQDFYFICAVISDGDHTVFRHIVEYLKEKSNPLAKFVSEMKCLPFAPDPSASDYVPGCTNNQTLHSLAVPDASVIQTELSIVEFKEEVMEARHVAVFIHCSAVEPKRCEWATLKFRRRAFHYSQNHSRHQRAALVSLFVTHGKDIKFMVFKRELAESFFEREFGWVPENIIDACDVARERGIVPSPAAFMKSLYGGNYCRRGRNFMDVSLPSSVALRHRVIDAVLVYEFCVKSLGLRGQEMAAASSDFDQKKRKRDESDERGLSSRCRQRRR